MAAAADYAHLSESELREMLEEEEDNLDHLSKAFNLWTSESKGNVTHLIAARRATRACIVSIQFFMDGSVTPQDEVIADLRNQVATLQHKVDQYESMMAGVSADED